MANSVYVGAGIGEGRICGRKSTQCIIPLREAKGAGVCRETCSARVRAHVELPGESEGERIHVLTAPWTPPTTGRGHALMPPGHPRRPGWGPVK